MIQKEFNVDDAKKIQSKETLGTIMTKDGFKVTLICWNVKSWFPIAGIVHLGDNNDYVMQWTKYGKVFMQKRESRRDLVLQMEGGDNV